MASRTSSTEQGTDEARADQVPGGRADKPKEIPARGWFQIVRRSFKEVSEDHLTLIAGGIAYTWFLALFPGIIAGVLLTFIPAFGDYINAQLLGGTQQAMVGNVIQSLYLNQRDYPEAAALSFLMMALILTVVLVYLRFAGTGAFMGDDDPEEVR